MYIRKVKQYNKKSGKQYHTYRLVETYRNSENKVRQRLLLNLGAQFDFPEEQFKLLADRIENITRGQQIIFAEDLKLENTAQQIAKRILHRTSENVQQQINTETSATEDYCSVDTNSFEFQQIRYIGAEHVGIETVKKLELDKLLTGLGFNHKQMNIALASILGRLIIPGSERATHKYLQTQSGLDELLGCDFQQLPLNTLYKIADKLLKYKDEIEQKLFCREKDLFQLEETITLYDLTNTYFEGRALGIKKAAYGRSKEKRNDCPLVTLAMVLDSSGFPKKTVIYEGNISEPKTLSDILKQLNGKSETTVVCDAGIATEENLQWLKQNGYHYIVVSRKARIEMPKEGCEINHQKDYPIKAKLVKNEETGENELYCCSELKAEKEKSMHNQAAARYETELKKLSEGIAKKGTVKKYTKILERLGRLKEKHKAVSANYEVEIIKEETTENTATIKWKEIERKKKQPGVYCLRSDRNDLDEQTFWSIYIMLTELEAAFRCLKSELGLRPIYHQITHRVDSHIFISVIAYHILHTIRYQLKQNGIDESWETIRQELKTHARITSTCKRQDGKILHIRKSSLANPRQTKIYQALQISTKVGKIEKSIA